MVGELNPGHIEDPGHIEEVFSQLTGAWMSEAVASSCLNKKCYPWAIISAYYGALTAARAMILFEKGVKIREDIKNHKKTWNHLFPRFNFLVETIGQIAGEIQARIKSAGLAAYKIRLDANYSWLIGAHMQHGYAHRAVDTKDLAEKMLDLASILIDLAEQGIILWIIDRKPKDWKCHLKHFIEEWEQFKKSMEIEIPRRRAEHIEHILKGLEPLEPEEAEYQSYWRETYEFQHKKMVVENFEEDVRKFNKEWESLKNLVDRVR
ncbi:TPA: hypothetical protein EYP70_07205 [Candidatus Bathyarchaeota archaeon]|nr:hypothetical protein [Candidatus Bathyarchaeota archaeon]